MKSDFLKLKATTLTFAVLMAIFAGLNATEINAQARRCDGGDSRITSAIFGQVGISTRQTARLIVANFHPAQFDPDDPMYPSDPVRPAIVELRILNRNGEIVARKRTRLEPGRSVSLEVNGETIADEGNRGDLRALVIFLHPGGRFHAKLIVPTLELIDNETGISSMFDHPATYVEFNPQPEPPTPRR